MKNFILTTLLIAFTLSCLYSQTRKIEVENLKNRYEKGQIKIYEYQEMSKKWHNIINNYYEYPDLPFDTNSKEIHYINNFTFQGLNKQNIFARILEYSAINFKSMDAVIVHKDFKSGKIILKGYFDVNYIEDYNNFWKSEKEKVNSLKCYSTYIFTIIDNRLKIDVQNIFYETFIKGEATGSYYVPDRYFDYSINMLLPITNSEIVEWKGRFSILNETDNGIKDLIYSIEKFIQEYISDYNF
jgi:hypothetical protein